MSDFPSQKLQNSQTQSLKQIQRMIMSPQMQQAITIMQMPILELSARLEAEMAENPLLEDENDNSDSDIEDEELSEDPFTTKDYIPEEELDFNDHNFEILKRIDDEFRECTNEADSYQPKLTKDEERLKTFMESSIKAPTSLFEYLMQQARETFSDEKKLAIAEAIIGNLNPSGLLEEPIDEIALLNGFDEHEVINTLSIIQEFEPYGIGAKNIQECLLLQLRGLNKSDTLAFRIIDECYEELLNNHIKQIEKILGCSKEDITEAVEDEIARLDFHPGANFDEENAAPIVPDVTIYEENSILKVVINDSPLPRPRFNRRYLQMLEDPTLSKETKEFIKQKITSARWFLQTVNQRNSTIERIAAILAVKQKSFFSLPTGQLAPLTMKMVADDLELHESTVARAVSNKYLQCPRGLFPLRYFFSNAYISNEGVDLSSETVREKLTALIRSENKQAPLSDEALSQLLEKQGIMCARRTIAKYRAALKLGNAKQRKKY